MFYCSKDNELYPESKVSNYRPNISHVETKTRLKKNFDLLLRTSRDLISSSPDDVTTLDEISAINESITSDIKKLSKVLSEDEFLEFLSAEVFIQSSSVDSTPCFDEYRTTYFRAVRELAGCIFFDPGWNCIHSYAEEFYAAIDDYNECIQETYHSEK